jgi:hypothetical protein
MSLSHILDKGTCPPAWLKLRAHRLHSCTDIQFDRDLIGLIRLNGNVPPGGARTFLHTDSLGVINWKTFNKDDIPAGADGDYLQTIGGLVEWASLSVQPNSISPGLANQVFHTDPTGTVAEWASDIEVPGDLKVNGDTDIVSDLQFNGSSGSAGQYLVKTGAATQSWQNLSVAPSTITPGLANQIMHTNTAGTAAEWSSNIIVPGTFRVNSSSIFDANVDCNSVVNVDGNFFANASSTLTDVDVEGDLSFVSNSGTVGQVLTKTGAATQDWQTLSVPTSSIVAGADNTVLTSAGGATYWITPNIINIIKYATTFNAQNINSGAGPTALSFNTTPYVNTAISTVGAPALISQPSATQFTIGTLGVYNIDITGYIDPTSAGIGNSVVTLSIEVAGSEKTEQCVVCNGEFSFSGRFSGILITAGANVRILARRVSGTGTLYTFASGSLAPSFASSIMFST